jgi:hypothetical protein
MQPLRLDCLRRSILPFFVAAVLGACDASTSQNGAAPPDGSITISPSSFTATVDNPTMAACGAGATTFQTETFFITAFDAKGQPVGNADIGISLDFAGNTTPVGVPLTFLEDPQGTIVSNPGTANPYQTTTDKSGNKTIYVTFTFSQGCSYAGAMTVTSGSLFAQMTFSVTSQ